MNVWTTLIGRIFKGSARDAVIFGERTPRGKVTRRDGAPARTGAPSGNARAAVSAVCAAVTRTERAPAAVFASAMHAPAMPDPAAAQSAERAVRVSVVRRMFVAPALLAPVCAEHASVCTEVASARMEVAPARMEVAPARTEILPVRPVAPAAPASAVSAVCAPSESKECAPAAGCAQGVCLSQTYAAVSRALDARIRALGESMRGLNVAERFAADKSAGYGRYKF